MNNNNVSSHPISDTKKHNNGTIRCRVRKSGQGFEGTIIVPGLKPTKLVKKDDTSVYANRSGVASAAKALADRFGFSVEVEDDISTKSKKIQKTPVGTSSSFESF